MASVTTANVRTDVLPGRPRRADVIRRAESFLICPTASERPMSLSVCGRRVMRLPSRGEAVIV
jgi:hypothetical protein